LVNANAKGSVNDLVIQNFKLSGIDQLKVAAWPDKECHESGSALL
jgi:hypothetical protein